MAEALTNASLAARRIAATPRGLGVVAPFFVARADNALLWDVEGRRYIDFAGGIAVQNTGHRHPKVMAAVREQLERFTHTCWGVAPYEGYVRLAERLNALVPGAFDKKTALFSTGAEATENAVKIARSFTGRPAVISFAGAFHGRTLLAMALTGKIAPYKQGFGPFPPDVYHLPFPSALHGVSVDDTLRALDALFKVDVDPKRVAAILIEPVQGEGGFYVAPPALVKALRQRCDEHGIVLVIDEVQTGFCRTGALFACERYLRDDGVEADLVPMAKSIGGGLPLAALTGRAAIMDAPQPGGLGGTYAGNPVAIAAAHAILDVIAEEDIAGRARALGERLQRHLEGLRARHPRIAEVRGLGAMIAIELMHEGKPDADGTKRLQQAAMERGLLLLTCGMYGNVVRFLFPLTIDDALFAEALGVLDASCAAAL